MKRYIFFLVSIIISFNCSYSQPTYYKLTSCIINDSLIIGNDDYIRYDEEYGDNNATIIYNGTGRYLDLYTKERDPDTDFQDLDIEFNEYKLDLKDSVLFIKGVINNIDNEKRLPYKNVLIFVCNDRVEIKQHYRYSLISSVAGLNAYKVVDSIHYYEVHNFQLDYARKIRYSNPGKQQFECKFDLTNNKTILVFGRYGYKTKAFDLTRQISCAIKPDSISVSEIKDSK